MKVVIGVGNELRKDDGIGIKIVRILSKTKRENIKFLIGYETPENLVQEIKKLNPEKVFIIDAVDFSGKIGEVKKVKFKGSSFSTHKLSYKILENLLRCEIEVIGIQPKDLSYGEELSMELSSKLEKIKENVEKLILS